MSKIIAVDTGNYAIKSEHFQFISGISEHLVKPPLAEDLIEYDGKFWTLSSSRINYKRDKTRDIRYFVLALFAIAKELTKDGGQPMMEQIVISAGLPPEHFGKGKESFANYFKRDGAVNFVYNDNPISIIIKNVFVYPQAFAAVAPQADKLREIPRVFLVDIGGMTTDILLLREGKPDLQFCRSLETGIITMQNELIGKINSLHDMTIEDEHIAAVLQDKNTILPDEVKDTIRSACKQHAENILDKLRELKVDLRLNPAIFIGGGSILLRQYIEQSKLVTQAEFIPNTSANAVGYKLLATSQLRKNSM